MARANTLNDDLDSTLNFDVERDLERQMNLFVEKPYGTDHYYEKIIQGQKIVEIWVDDNIFQNFKISEKTVFLRK